MSANVTFLKTLYFFLFFERVQLLSSSIFFLYRDNLGWQQVIIDRFKNREEKQDMLIRTIAMKLTHYTYDFDNDDYKICMHVACESSLRPCYNANKYKFRLKCYHEMFLSQLRKCELTNCINSGFPIRKPSRRSTKEVNPIRQLISPSQRLELVVVPIINQRITKNEVAWNLWCTFNTTPQAKRKNRHVCVIECGWCDISTSIYIVER
ncbi:hypothetical protein GLYMA_10G126025v4 [Glycine max]|nr:hypothetical protein GLYMA_10G126025v4 [Glycine max]KAH1137951.1 hypothetical protein GYH30_027800 [Glycine max]